MSDSTGAWHGNALVVYPLRSKDEWKTEAKDIAESDYIIAHAGSQGSCNEVREMMNLPGLKMFFRDDERGQNPHGF